MLKPFIPLTGIVAGALAGLCGTALLLVLSDRDGTAVLPAECGIVFGATVHATFDAGRRVVGSKPGPGILRRMSTAVELYRDGKIERLVLTGGKGDGMRLSEAEAMHQFAASAGLPEEALVTEDRATSTRENLFLSRPLVRDCRGVVAISDGYHLARIRLLARRMGWELETVPASQRATRGFEAWSIVREVGGILYYSVY